MCCANNEDNLESYWLSNLERYVYGFAVKRSVVILFYVCLKVSERCDRAQVSTFDPREEKDSIRMSFI